MDRLVCFGISASSSTSISSCLVPILFTYLPFLFLLLLSLSSLFSLLYSSIVQYAFGVREERREVVGVVGSGLSIGLIRPEVVWLVCCTQPSQAPLLTPSPFSFRWRLPIHRSRNTIFIHLILPCVGVLVLPYSDPLRLSQRERLLPYP